MWGACDGRARACVQVMDAALAAPGAAYSPAMVAGVLMGLTVVQGALIIARSALLSVSGERIAANIRKVSNVRRPFGSCARILHDRRCV